MDEQQHPEPSFSASGDRTYLNFLNQLTSIRVEAGDSRALSVVEFVSPRGFGPPLHRHLYEDELFIVTDGELSLRLGDEEVIAGAGSVSYLPFGVPHTFVVVSETATILNVTAVNHGSSPRFDRMVSQVAEPLVSPSELIPGAIDPGMVAQINHENGIEILGPPPGL